MSLIKIKNSIKIFFVTFLLSIIICISVKAVSIASYSGGNFKIGENIYIQPEENVNSDVAAIGGDIYVNGKVDGNAFCIGGNIYVNGTVNGNVMVIGGTIKKGTEGKIGGTTNQIGRGFNLPFGFNNRNFGDMGKYYFKHGSFLSLFLLFIFCFIINQLMSKNITSMALSIENGFSKSLLYGYGVFVIMPIILIVLILTIVGILLVPLLLLALYVLFLIGFTSLALFVGKRLALKIINKNISDNWSILIGVILYEILKSLSFWNIGSIISFLFVTPLALGLAVGTNFGTFKPWKKRDSDSDESEWNKYKKY